MLHLGLFAFLLNRSGLLAPVALEPIAPVVQGQLVERDAETAMATPAGPEGAEGEEAGGGAVGVAVEPDREMIREAARRLLEVDSAEADPAAYKKLVHATP
jgi:hypothetical protein